jgi:hypothetical protein
MLVDPLLQIICLAGGLLLTYLGSRMVFSKKYYMRVKEGYLKEDFETAYNKLSINHLLYSRYRWGVGALTMGIILLSFPTWITFIH